MIGIFGLIVGVVIGLVGIEFAGRFIKRILKGN
jgi:hypothetical protein